MLDEIRKQLVPKFGLAPFKSFATPFKKTIARLIVIIVIHGIRESVGIFQGLPEESAICTGDNMRTKTAIKRQSGGIQAAVTSKQGHQLDLWFRFD
ncbi:hypothetical protein APICC_02470 [Apis cerana cerana]|uniref:Uncharacterized protein n=1 Tax=Apis cerana cerana TaxID=94128 RepID=A0A2A3EJW8_APICC|nr:hypothetical protein APICC_02470 [Apis cerana cerana]